LGESTSYVAVFAWHTCRAYLLALVLLRERNAMLTSAQIAQKWVDRTSAATQAYTDGINAVTVNPMQKAAANSAGYLAGVQAAVASGKWQAGLNRVSQQQWQQKAIQLGAQRLATGVAAAKMKYQSFMDSFLPVLSQNVAQVNAMPNNSYEARKARAVAMMDLNHQFKRSS
jgi:DUF917 family protein